MRYLVFSDIHGNLEALLAVLNEVKKKRIDYYLFLGDLVGYGASPNEVLQQVQAWADCPWSEVTMIKPSADLNPFRLLTYRCCRYRLDEKGLE